jgi:hypothetical protein
MTSTPTDAPLSVDAPQDPHLEARLRTTDLSTVLEEVTRPGCERVAAHLADPAATASRAAYATWLRRQVHAWGEVRLPAVSAAAPDWPLASVRPQCLDVVGLLIADLRELNPRMRPTVVPHQATGAELPQPGIVVAAVDLCVRLAAPPARLLDAARALTEGPTHLHSATRYLARCADLAERAPDLRREIDRWAGTAGPTHAQLAVLTAASLADRLAHALEARVRTGW